MNKKQQPIVSLCMPTNGVIEWVFPVLDSIYGQGINDDLYEVVISDNGNNQEFKSEIRKYISHHSNLIYFETEALPFRNEIESYIRARGVLIKFINHRTMLVKGTIQKLIDFAKDNMDSRPIAYFSNGVLKMERIQYEYDTFNLFVKNLSYWSSWSTGMAIWKEDFDKLSKDVDDYNELFPHTTILFSERNRGKYIIDNTVIYNELPTKNKPKGEYDLFGAFGIEYPGIICDLLRANSISNETYRFVADKNLDFIAYMYFQYFIKKDYCSYDLSGVDRMYGVFYTKWQIKIKVLKRILKEIAKSLIRIRG